MRLFDTHCHIADEQFNADLEDVIARYREAGVQKALVVADPCEDIPNEEKVFSLIHGRDHLYGAIGIHPHNAKRRTDETIATVKRYLEDPKCRLLGEIGLDYHYDLSPRETQRAVFDEQLELAYTLKKPVQLHIREAHGETLDMLRARAAAGRMPEGILHCCTASWESVKVYLKLGLYISLSGAVTFKNAPKLAEVARNVPSDRLLIETDCPYMAPVPMRGRRNEPSFLPYTLAKAAALREVSPETLAEQLWINAHRALHIENELQ